MRAGKLRHRLHIQVATDVRDDIGGVRQEWDTLATVWGQIEPLRLLSTAKEELIAQQIEARVTHRITLRYRAGLDSRMRLQEELTGRIYNPANVLNIDERNRTIEILAVEVNPSP